jgi:hypothetical protein
VPERMPVDVCFDSHFCSGFSNVRLLNLLLVVRTVRCGIGEKPTRFGTVAALSMFK